MEVRKKELSLRDIQLCELAILVELKKVCEKYGLRYNLLAGTLLGAIRHKGFIPWDDDIDVSMARPDYDKLINLYKEGVFPEYIRLYAFELGNFNRSYMKLVDTRTVVKNQNEYLIDGNSQNLWIDIIPVSGVPFDEKKRMREFQKSGKLNKMVRLSNAYLGRGASPVRAVGKTIVALFAKSLGSEFWIKKITGISNRYPYEESQYVGQLAFALCGERSTMLKCEFEDQTKVEFEGIAFTAVSTWDKYLTRVYGDYMKLPPENKRKTHHIMAWRIDSEGTVDEEVDSKVL